MIEDKYLYLIGSLFALLIVAVIFVLRRDMRSFILKAGTLGGLISVVTEYWFFQDYWRIPSTFGVATPSIDDFICGFAFVALGGVLYPFIFKLPFLSSKGRWKKYVLPVLAISLFSMWLFVSVLKVNSIILASALPLALTAIILVKRPDLWRRAVFGATCLGLLSIAVYGVLFGIISPDYIESYFLLAYHPWNPNPLGFIPLSELMWFISMGAVGAVFYEFIVQPTLQPKT